MDMTYLALGMAVMAAATVPAYVANVPAAEPYLRVTEAEGRTSYTAENVYACKRITVFDASVICTASSLRDPRICHAVQDANFKQQCLAQVKP